MNAWSHTCTHTHHTQTLMSWGDMRGFPGCQSTKLNILLCPGSFVRSGNVDEKLLDLCFVLLVNTGEEDLCRL